METRQYNPIEPGWDFNKEELIKNIGEFKRQYVPIEPKSGFPNPYRAIVKHTLNKVEEGKCIQPAIELIASGLFLPGFMLYYKYKAEDIEKEIASENREIFIRGKKGRFEAPISFYVEGMKTFYALYYLNKLFN